MEKLAFTPQEVAQSLGLHLNTVRKLLRAGALPAVRIGRRYVIPKQALDALLNKNPAGQGGAR